MFVNIFSHQGHPLYVGYGPMCTIVHFDPVVERQGRGACMSAGGRYQPPEPGTPLNGPTTREVIQPP